MIDGWGWSDDWPPTPVIEAPGWSTPREVSAPASVDISGSGVVVLELAAPATATVTGSGLVAIAAAADAALGADLPAARCTPAVSAPAELAITGTGTTHVHLHDALPLPYSLPFVLGGATPIRPSPETNAPATIAITAAFECAVAAAARAFISYDTRATHCAAAVGASAELPIEGTGSTAHITVLPFLLPAQLPA